MRGADRMAAEETGSGTGDISGNLTFKPTRVEFTCPEEFKLDGLHVFDAKGEPVMPFTDEEKDKPVEGVYMLMPGEYTYSFYPGKEGYRDIEKTPFTVKRNQEALSIELLPEKVEQTESAEEENEAAPVRVEFVGPEDFDYASLEVFDAAGLKMAPVNDAESGKALPGVYELMPGEYSYRIAADGEEAEQAEKTAFTVEPGQEKMTIDLQPEAHSEVKEFTEVVTTPPEQVPAERGGRCAMFDAYMDNPEMTEAFCAKLNSILTKLYCYHDLTVYLPAEETAMEQPQMTDITMAVRACLLGEEKRDAVTEFLVKGKKQAMIMLCRQDFYMTVFGADDDLLRLVRLLAASEGLFVRPAAI